MSLDCAAAVIVCLSAATEEVSSPWGSSSDSCCCPVLSSYRASSAGAAGRPSTTRWTLGTSVASGAVARLECVAVLRSGKAAKRSRRQGLQSELEELLQRALQCSVNPVAVNQFLGLSVKLCPFRSDFLFCFGYSQMI